MQIILATASPRRVQLLKKTGLDFETIVSNFDERSIQEADPLKLVKTLALEKARTVAKLHPQAIVVGADTMLQIEDEVVGKPNDLGDARRMIRKARGKEVKDFVGLAVVYQGKEKSMSSVGIAQTKNYTDQEIEDYFSRVNPLDKAGGFAGSSAEGGEFLENYQGEPGQELGLPLTSLKKFLNEFGVNF